MSVDSVERDRFTELYRSHYAHVLAYATRRIGADAAHDVLAETFIAAWRELATLPADPLPWLYRAAAYRIAHERRTAARRARLTARAAELAHSTVPDHAPRVVETARVLAELQRLAATDREALRLVCWEDLDHASAAYVMGCSVTAFKVRLFRARRRLARRLSRPDDPATDDASGRPPRHDPQHLEEMIR